MNKNDKVKIEVTTEELQTLIEALTVFQRICKNTLISPKKDEYLKQVEIFVETLEKENSK